MAAAASAPAGLEQQHGMSWQLAYGWLKVQAFQFWRRTVMIIRLNNGTENQ